MSRGRLDPYLVVPVVGPALLLFLGGDDFMFDPPGWVDTFTILGRFWHYADHNPLFEAYKGSRLPWLLPGWLAHQWLSATAAAYLLHGTALAGSAVAVYLLLRDTLGQRQRPTAAVVAAAWSCYTWIHGDGGWDYHLLAASAYYLWSLWMLVRATASARSRWWLAGAGATFACAVHTHLVYVGFAPVAALLWLATVDGPGRWAAARAVARDASLGALGVTVALAAINAATGGEWLFFMPQIEFTLDLAREGNRWVEAPSTWVGSARHLVIPVLAVAAGLVWLLVPHAADGGDARTARLGRVLVWQGLLAFAIVATLQFVVRQTVLHPSYGSYPLYVHVFPMLGVLLGTASSVENRRDLPFALGAALVIVLPLLLWPSTLRSATTTGVEWLRLPVSPSVLGPLLVGALGAGLLTRVAPHGRAVVFALLFGVLNAWLTWNPAAYELRTPGVNRDMLPVFRSLDRFTAALDPTLFAIRFWNEPETVAGPRGPVDLAHVFQSFLSTRRRSLVTAAYDRPRIPAETFALEDLYQTNCLGILSSLGAHASTLSRIVPRLRSLDLRLKPVGRHDASSGSLSVALTVFAVWGPNDDPPRDDVPCPPRAS